MKRMMLAALVALLVLSPAWAQLPNNQRPAGPLPVLPLADQFDRPFNPAVHHGSVLVLIYGDRASADANKILGEYLHVTFHPTAKGLPPGQARQQPPRPLPDAPPGAPSPDVHLVAVACCGRVPTVIQGWIRSQIKAGAGELPVFLDFTDAMKNTFGQAEKVPNLVIVDRAGNVRYTASGPFEPEQVTQLTTILESLRRER
jgi:hypothetical protein